MADYTGGASSGALQNQEVVSSQVLNAYRQQQMAAQAMEMIRRQQLLGMRGAGIQALQGAMGPQVPQPPAPQPGAMSPGGGNPQVQGGPPPPPMGGSMMAGPQGGMPPVPQGAPPPPGAQGMAPTQALGAPPIQPFRPMPTSPTPGGPGAMPMPPGQAQAQPAQEQIVPPQHIDIKGVLSQMDKLGLNPEQKADALEGMMPMIQAAQQQELSFFKAQTAAQAAAINAYKTTMHAEYEQGRLELGRVTEERRKDQGEAALQIKREKESRLKANASASAGGAANLKSTELIYPKGADGRPDETQAPIGVRGITKTGKIITLDADGKPTAPGAGGTAKEAKDTKEKGGQNVRTGIVKAGVTNSLARLDEIDKLGDVSTSSFFGQHGDNPMTRGAYGAAKSLQSKGQQDADAKWASMIDEAIPVFTGGLRGSDAFRRFLIEQAPGPGDKPETIREKKRLFRQNIEGTSKAFFGKFKSDPSMWAPGVTKEEVQGGGVSRETGPAVGTVQDGYRFKGGDPAKPESWEKI